MDNYTLKIFKNYLYNSSYQLFLIILPIITLPYLARVLGPTYLGINSYTNSVTNYFIMFAVLGTTTYAQREIAYLRDDWNKVTNLFWEIELLNIIATVFSYIALSIVIILMPNYHIFFWIYSISVIANIFDVSWLFMGLENFSVLALRNFFVKTLSVAMIFLFVKSKDDLIIYILINSISVLFSNLLLWPYLRKWNIFINLNDLKNLNPFKHFRGTFALFIPQISITLYTVLNKVLLGYMGKIKEGSYFDNADKIIRLTFTVLMSLSTVLMPVIAKEISRKNIEKVNLLLKKSLSFSLCIAIALFFGFLGISSRLVPLFLGEQYLRVIPLLKIQSFILIPMAIANVVGNQYLVPSRKSKQLNISIFLGSIFNIIVSVPLIMNLGAMGASIAILLSESLVTVAQLWQVRKYIRMNGIYKDIGKYIIASLVMFSFLNIEQIAFSGWISLIIGIVFGAIVYFIVLTLLHAEILDYAIRIIKSKKRG